MEQNEEIESRKKRSANWNSRYVRCDKDSKRIRLNGHRIKKKGFGKKNVESALEYLQTTSQLWSEESVIKNEGVAKINSSADSSGEVIVEADTATSTARIHLFTDTDNIIGGVHLLSESPGNDRAALANEYDLKKATESGIVEEATKERHSIDGVGLNGVIESEKVDFLEGTEHITKKGTTRHIADVDYVIKQLFQIMKHSKKFGCTSENLIQTGQHIFGLGFIKEYKCNMCNQKFKIYSDKSINPKMKGDFQSMPVLMAAVAGVITSGNGQVTLNKILSSLEIPVPSSATYTACSKKINNEFMLASEEDMIAAGKEEAELARLCGDISEDGVPLVPVTADGCWSRRSFGKNYAALGGTACIVGLRTGKVLYCGVKNKYCYTCSVQKSKGEAPKKHTCFKNYEGTSTSMEQSAIVEGFRCSMKMHGVRYSHLVADGDSVVYPKIIAAKPYGDKCVVQKIFCKNHLLRNFRNKLEKYCRSSSNRNTLLIATKRAVLSRSMKLTYAVDCACQYRGKIISSESIKHLRADILNACNHVFGDHSNCAEYFCDPVKKIQTSNLVPQMKKTGVYENIMEFVKPLAEKSDSLIRNLNNNQVESFNATACSAIAGKRNNYTGSNGYHGRMALSVIRFNRGAAFRTLHKRMYNQSPGAISKGYENTLFQRRKWNREHLKARKRIQYSNAKAPSSVLDEDYGLADLKPDMRSEEYTEAAQKLIADSTLSEEERTKLEEETRGQSANLKWIEERCTRITASRFGSICKMRTTTSSASAVKEIVAKSFFSNDAVVWGLQMEATARKQLEDHLCKTVHECGLTIHPEHSFLAASADGLIENDTVVEIKCPYLLKDFKTKKENRQFIQTKGLEYLHIDGTLKKNHNYYYQIQGQLEVTNREIAKFVIWSPKYFTVETIHRDKNFWESKMLPRLTSFFNNCLLPELVDSRLDRGRALRQVNFEGRYLSDTEKKSTTKLPKKPVQKKVLRKELSPKNVKKKLNEQQSSKNKSKK